MELFYIVTMVTDKSFHVIRKIHKNKVFGEVGMDFSVELINTRETPRENVKQAKPVLLNPDLFMDQ